MTSKIFYSTLFRIQWHFVIALRQYGNHPSNYQLIRVLHFGRDRKNFYFLWASFFDQRLKRIWRILPLIPLEFPPAARFSKSLVILKIHILILIIIHSFPLFLTSEKFPLCVYFQNYFLMFCHTWKENPFKKASQKTHRWKLKRFVSHIKRKYR